MQAVSANPTAELIWMLCHPESPFQRPSNTVHRPMIRETADLMRVLMHLDDVGYYSKISAKIAYLYALSSSERERLSAALEALGATRMLNKLRQFAGLIQFPAEGARLSVADATILAESRGWEWRLLSEVFAEGYDLPKLVMQRLLASELAEHLPRRPAPDNPADTFEVSANPPTFPPGTRVVLFYAPDYKDGAVNAWLLHQRTAMAIGSERSFPAGSWQDCATALEAEAPGTWFFDRYLLAGALGSAPADFIRFSEGHSNPSLLFDCLNRELKWAIARVPSPEFPAQLGFFCQDPKAIAEFLAAIEAQKSASILAVSSTDFGSGGRAFDTHFVETNDYGRAALIAGEGDVDLPLIGLEFGDYSGFWWLQHLEHSDILDIQADFSPGSPHTRMIVRPRNIPTFLGWWSKIGLDANVAGFALPGQSDPQGAMWWFRHGDYQNGLRAISDAFGWAYAHIWGGGSDEHVALFCACDPARVERVRAFAESKRRGGWCFEGKW